MEFGIRGYEVDLDVEETHSGKYIGKRATDIEVIYITHSQNFDGQYLAEDVSD